MYQAQDIEDFFKKIILDLPSFLPEGVIDVDIGLLQRFSLLNLEEKKDPSLTRYFHVLDSADKITLVNDQFVIWIVPDNSGVTPKTFVIIALNKEKELKLELAFKTSDIYNSSKLVLRILEKFLLEIQENEESLKPYSL